MEHIHSCIRKPPDSTASPNRQNHGRASDCCPTLCSSVKSPATFNLSSVMSPSVAKYSGSTDRCRSAIRACLYIDQHFLTSTSNLWMLSHALFVFLWLFALRTSVRKRSDFSPRARQSPSRTSVTWPLRSSASIIAIGLSDRRSISPGANAEGSVIHSISGVNHSSRYMSERSSDTSPAQALISGIVPFCVSHLVSSSSLMMTKTSCS